MGPLGHRLPRTRFSSSIQLSETCIRSPTRYVGSDAQKVEIHVERKLADRACPIGRNAQRHPYIIGNEAAERFSFYGMKTILFVFMTTYLLNSDGAIDPMSDSEASVWYHIFTFAVYLTPLLGAIIADVFLGKYVTIIVLSLVYCAGHLVLALDETRFGLSLGLGLIAVGAGGIKPCVSAHVGDQFGKSNSHLLEKVFGWFYFSINLGAGASSIATPWLLEAYGPQVAFGVPGGLMLLATWVFWPGRRGIHPHPAQRAILKEVFSPVGLKIMFRLCLLYLFVLMFWALFDQTGSRWVQQAGHMDRHFLGVEWLPSQIQVMNPILIMCFIPLFAFWVYPAINRVFKLTPLRKIGIGFFITGIAFLIPAWIENQIQAGHTPNIVWQLLAYAVLTAAEVMISITALEFSHSGPQSHEVLIMGLFMASVALGNLFTAGVNYLCWRIPPALWQTWPESTPSRSKSATANRITPHKSPTPPLAALPDKEDSEKSPNDGQRSRRFSLQEPSNPVSRSSSTALPRWFNSWTERCFDPSAASRPSGRLLPNRKAPRSQKPTLPTALPRPLAFCRINPGATS